MGEEFDSNLVFDLGLHKGEDTEFYLKKGFRVVAIEAMPALCEESRERLHEHVESGRLTILNVAIAEQRGPVTFYVNPSTAWGTIRRHWAERNSLLGSPPSGEITVEGVEFDEILTEHGTPYYAKIDIEGADLLCLEALSRRDCAPKYISIESDKASWKALSSEFELLEKIGYSRFKVVSQPDVPGQVCPDPAREGVYVDHHFVAGASGLFGEEAPGQWKTKKQAMRSYRFIFLRYWLYGDQGVLRTNSRFRVLRGAQRYLRKWLRGLLGAQGWYDTHAAK